jgi:hypothetical protein
MAKRTLSVCLGVLVLGVVSFSTAQQSTTPAASAFTWTVVGVTRLNNITTNVNQTLFTPTTTGLYRVTFYSEVENRGNIAYWTILYTNGFGTQQQVACPTCDSSASPGADATIVAAFQPNAGTPVTLQVTPNLANMPYSIVATFERLETPPES